MNIALIGFRGAGKTTIARILAGRLGRRLVSTDDEIKKRAKMSIDKLVGKFGWERFRELESETIEAVSEYDDCVLDTGGGAVLRNENVVSLKKSSIVVLLTANTKEIRKRIQNSKKRPPLTKLGTLQEVTKVMEEREQKYRNAADYTIDTSQMSPEEVSELIMHYIQTEIQ